MSPPIPPDARPDAPADARPDPIAQLRLERRSYIIGTLVVWAVILVSMVVLVATMRPEVFADARTETMRQAMARMGALAPLTWQQQMLLYVVELAGAVALFFLNWRFSLLMQCPRSAFVAPEGEVLDPSKRWLWWAALLFNSMFYVSLLVPQLIITYLLASWGKDEIQRRMLQPPPSSEAPL